MNQREGVGDECHGERKLTEWYIDGCSRIGQVLSPQDTLIFGLHGLKEEFCCVFPEQSGPVAGAVVHEGMQALQTRHLKCRVSREEHLAAARENQWGKGKRTQQHVIIITICDVPN